MSKPEKPRKRTGGIIRPLPPGDPRDLNHPGYKEAWCKLAEAIAARMADEDFARDQGSGEATAEGQA